MRRLIASTFVSLDGVMQAPGGPEEDDSGGFAYGGWMFAHRDDDSMDIAASGFDGKDRELVLGRKTYEIFAAYWPRQPDDHPIAKTFNATRKHVASRTSTTLDWNNSALLRGDVASAVDALKAEPGPDLQIIGSGDLIQTLQSATLIDEYHVWTFPVVLGRGKRLFGEAARPSALRLVHSRVSTSGVVMSTYEPGATFSSVRSPLTRRTGKEDVGRERLRSRASMLPFPTTVPELIGDLVLLRGLDEADVPAWYERATDAESARLAGDPIPESMAMGTRWLERNRQRFRDRSGIRWAIVPKGSIASVGSIGLAIRSDEDRVAELGLVVGRAHWSRGLGTSAARAVVAYAFDVLGVVELRAELLASNLASKRMLEKLAFQFDRVIPDFERSDAGSEDGALYVLRDRGASSSTRDYTGAIRS